MDTRKSSLITIFIPKSMHCSVDLHHSSQKFVIKMFIPGIHRYLAGFLADNLAFPPSRDFLVFRVEKLSVVALSLITIIHLAHNSHVNAQFGGKFL